MPFKNKESAKYYLAAFIDGEGTISTNRSARSIRITNTDIYLINTVSKCLDVLDIKHKIYKRKKQSEKLKEAFDVTIFGNENFILVQNLIPIQCQEKLLKLDRIINSYSEKHDICHEKLKYLYINGNSVSECAKAFNVSSGVIFYYMRKFNIKRRTNSESIKLWWDKNEVKDAI